MAVAMAEKANKSAATGFAVAYCIGFAVPFIVLMAEQGWSMWMHPIPQSVSSWLPGTSWVEKAADIIRQPFLFANFAGLIAGLLVWAIRAWAVRKVSK